MRILLHTRASAAATDGLDARASALVNWLAARGHTLIVVAAPAPQSAGWRRALDTLSTAFITAPALVTEAASFRPDLVVSLAVSNAAVSAALGAARLAGVPAWLHLAAPAPSVGLELHFARVSLEALNAEMQLAGRGVPPARRLPLAPWIDTSAIAPPMGPSPLRRRLKFVSDAVVVLHLGGISAPDAVALIEAARRVPQNGAIAFVASGEGPGLALLVEAARSLRPLRLLPWPVEDGLNALLALADIHLMPAGVEEVDPLVPAKLAALLASGRPIIAGTPPDAVPASLVGAVVPARCGADGLAATIIGLAADAAERHGRGLAARLAAQDYFAKERVLRQLERGLLSLAAS